MDDAGVEPLAMKLFAGIVLLVVGLGIAYGVYSWVSGGVQQMLSYAVSVEPSSVVVGRPAENENSVAVRVKVTEFGNYTDPVHLSCDLDRAYIKRYEFSINDIQPEFTATLTLYVDSTSALGQTDVVIRATSGEIEQSATLRVTVV